MNKKFLPTDFTIDQPIIAYLQRASLYAEKGDIKLAIADLEYVLENSDLEEYKEQARGVLSSISSKSTP